MTTAAVREDGAVVVPAGLASTVFAATTLYLADQTRANGGALTPEARNLLRALHRAAQGSPEQPTPVGTFPTESTSAAPLSVITTGDAARALECTRQWVAHLVRTGRLSGMKVGRSWLIDAASLDHLRFEDNAHEEDHRPRGDHTRATPARQP